MLERASRESANTSQTLVPNQADNDQGWALDWAIFRKCYDLFL
jgi:hypothetical protein